MNWIQVQSYADGPHTFVGVEVFLPPRPLPGKKYPLVMLLHGRGEDRTQWMRQTRLEKYAENAGVAIALIQGNQSFYVNSMADYRWGDYLQDVTKQLTGWFPLEEKPVVMGVDMGGYGALMAAQNHPESYRQAVAVDPLLDVEELYGTGFEPKPECLFGPKEELEKNGYKLHHQYQIPVTIAWNDAEKTSCGNAEIVQLQGQSQADRMEEAFALLLKGGLKR